MAKAVFYIKDKVQEVGYRAFVMERLLETNLKGGAVNTEDGNLKVLVEGEESRINEFIERLKRERPELSENPVLTGPEFNEALEIPDEIRLSHALEMNQFGKAVVYLAGIDNKLDGIEKRLDNGFGAMGNSFESLGKKIGNLGDRLEFLLREILNVLKSRV